MNKFLEWVGVSAQTEAQFLFHIRADDGLNHKKIVIQLGDIWGRSGDISCINDNNQCEKKTGSIDEA